MAIVKGNADAGIGDAADNRSSRDHQRWIHSTTRRFAVTDEEVLYKFFRLAMAGVLLAHAALDSYANESIPVDFVLEENGTTYDRNQLENRGIELPLSKVLAAATSRVS